MAIPALLKALIDFSNTPGNTPESGGLPAAVNGQLRINQADAKLFSRNPSGADRVMLTDDGLRAQPGNPVGDSFSNTTPEAKGAPATGDATPAITAALAEFTTTKRKVDLIARDYPYTADKLDTSKVGAVAAQARFRSVMAGDSLVRDRKGKVIGLAYNHRQQECYNGPEPSTVPGTVIDVGNLEAPPISTAQAAGPIDYIAYWYGDLGIDWYRQQTGIGVDGGAQAETFYASYDMRNLHTSAAGYDQSRHPLYGFYRGDDPNYLDWMAYELREAGIKAICPVAFDLDITTWSNPTNRHYWLWRLFQTPNFQGLAYIPWAQSSRFDAAATGTGAPVGLTQSAVTAQWQSLYNSLAQVNRNNYVLKHGGKRWFTVFTWDSEQLRKLFDTDGSATNFRAFLVARAAEVVAMGYGGLCVYTHTPTADATLNRASLLADNVLYTPCPYGMQPFVNTGGTSTYQALARSYNPPASGTVLTVNTAMQAIAPLPLPDANYKWPGSTPADFTDLLTTATRAVVDRPDIPQQLMIAAIGELWEQGPGLIPNVRDGRAYLDAFRKASSVVSAPGGIVEYPLTLQSGWTPNAAGNKRPVYYRDPEKWVHVSGQIIGGTVTAGTVVAQLPVGFRPAATDVFVTGTSGGFASWTVDSNGNLTAISTLNATLTGLKGISFKAA